MHTRSIWRVFSPVYWIRKSKKSALGDTFVRFLRRHTAKIDNVKVVFRTDEAFSNAWFHKRMGPGELHEPAISRIVVDTIMTSSTFFDVGACIGYFSCLAGKANPNASVYSFELNKALHDVILKNIAANDLENVIATPNGVLDKPGAVSSTGMQDGKQRLSVSVAAESTSPTFDSTVTTIDKFCKDRGILPDFIKIDVDGPEYQVLLGANEVISRVHPTLIVELSEIHIDYGYTKQDIISFLHKHGYRVFVVSGDQHRVALTNINEFEVLPSIVMTLCLPESVVRTSVSGVPLAR